MVEERNLEKREMAHFRIGSVMIDPARLNRPCDRVEIPCVNVDQVVAAEDRAGGKEEEKAKGRNAKFPVALEEKDGRKDGQEAVFRHRDKCKQERPQDTGVRPPEKAVNAKRQDEGYLPRPHSVPDTSGGKKAETA